MERSRFGEAAVRSGYLSSEQLDLLERIQAEDLNSGRVPRPLPILGIQEGFMTFRQVSEILEQAERKRHSGKKTGSTRTLSGPVRPRRLATLS